MDQISPPMRIALAACLVFAALWFVVLRPKPVEETPIPTTAAEATPAADATSGSTPAKAADTAAPQAAAPKAAADEPAAKAAPQKLTGPKAVVADLQAKNTVVLLFSAAKGRSDDRAVRAAVAKVDRHDGKVRVHRATMTGLPEYEAITKNVPVTTSPTVLVIDGKTSQARVITGLTTTREIDKAVDSALKD